MNDLSELLSSIYDQVDTLDTTSLRIVSAAHQCFVDEGFETSTMVRIAEVAGVGVATVYRRFGTRQNLVRCTILQEAKRLTQIIIRIGAQATDPLSGLVETFGAFVNEATAPKLLTRSIRESSAIGELSAFLTDDAVISAARSIVSAYLAKWQSAGQLADIDPDIVGEIFARLMTSLVLSPATVFPMRNAEEAKAFANKYLAPLLGPAPAHHA